MISKLYKYIFRKWENWEVYEKLHPISHDDYKIIITLIRKSNDGLIEFKTVKNY